MISPLPYLERAAMILRAGCKAIAEVNGIDLPGADGTAAPPGVAASSGTLGGGPPGLAQACVAMLASYLACNGDEACQIRVLGVYDEAVQACLGTATTSA